MPEKAAGRRSGDGRALLALMLVLIMLLPLGCYLARSVIALGNKPEPFYESHVSQGGTCLWEMKAGEVRLHHWEELRRIREDVIRYGKRDEKGLYACQNCHKSRANFCDRCHNSVGLTPDCFDCHPYPEHTGQDLARHVPADTEPLAAKSALGPQRLPER